MQDKKNTERCSQRFDESISDYFTNFSMKYTRDEMLENIPFGENKISMYYQRGLMHSADATVLSFHPSKKKVERAHDASEIIDYQNLAREQLLLALSQTGTCKDQRIKIKAALLLVNLSPIPSEEASGYFYHAVEIATRYIGQDFYDTDEGRSIVKCYLTSIDPNFQSQFIDTHHASFFPLLKLIIRSESERRKTERMRSTEAILSDSGKCTSHYEILHHLRGGIGPFRLSLFSEMSDTYMINHDIDSMKPVKAGELAIFPKHIVINIFDRLRRYQILVDRGSNERENQFSAEELREIIYPALEKYIQMKEHTFFLSVMDNMGVIDTAESQMSLSLGTSNYRPFVAYVIAGSGSTKGPLHNDVEFVESCCQAIDICRLISLAYKQGNTFKGGNILEEMGKMLQGTMQRKVLHMVTSLLLSRNETMDGTGYPYGLGKKNIPIEGRIYAIIRAYEALSEIHTGNHKKILSAMNDWSEWGYFDQDVLLLFSEFFPNAPGPTIEKNNALEKKNVPSPRRKTQYEWYRSKWYRLMDTMRKIEDGYDEVRQKEDDRAKQNILFLAINKLQLGLRREADQRKIILLSRHGATESDTPAGPPGHDDEVLTESGELSSLKKGEFLEGLRFSLTSSPLLRAEQTSKIICQKVRKCVEVCLSCPHITKVEALRNPIKSRDNGRYNSYVQKIFADNTGGLMEFLIGVVSSPKEEIQLFITHRDLGRHIIFWLQNLFSEEGVVGEKNPFGNEEVYEFLFRGDHVLSDSEISTRGLLFPIHSWKIIVEHIGEVTEWVFGERFTSTTSSSGVNLIELHDKFLDFLDRNMYIQGEKMGEFFSRFEQDPLLAHTLGILREEGFSPEGFRSSDA